MEGGPAPDRPETLDAEGLEALLEATEERVLDLDVRIRGGEIAVRPRDTGPCAWCDYADLCRFEAWMAEEVEMTEFSSWETTRSELTTLRWDTGITPHILTMEVVEPSQLSLVDLYRYSRYLAQQGLDSDDYQLALWNKLLQPAAIAGLVLVAISFIFGPLREGTMGFRIFAGVIVGIVFRTSQDLLGPASLVFGFSPLYAALAPILLCIFAGMLMLSRAR